MYKYAILNSDNVIIDIIEVTDKDTLDNYQLPDGPCIAYPTWKTEQELSAGMVWNPITDIFE